MTDRIPLIGLTSEQLDALYVRLEELEKDAAITEEVMKNADEDMEGAREVAQYFKALAERTQAWGEQHRDRANRYRARTDAVTTECHTLNSETRGLNPFAMAGRRDAVARIRAALQAISHDTPVPDDPRVTALEAENARLRAAWTSARHRAATYLQNNQKLSASLHNNHTAYLQLGDRYRGAEARAEQAKAAVERVRQIHTRGPRTDACNDCGQPWPCEVTRALGE